MSKIDWDNAPVTATHYGGGKFWRIQDGGDGWETECAFQWVHSSGSPFNFKDVVVRPQTHTKPHQSAQEPLNGDDPVNHPKHYKIAPEVEAIDIIRASLTPEQFKGYLLGNFLKYRLRAGDKGDLNQDIQKSNWYKRELNK